MFKKKRHDERIDYLERTMVEMKGMMFQLAHDVGKLQAYIEQHNDQHIVDDVCSAIEEPVTEETTSHKYVWTQVEPDVHPVIEECFSTEKPQKKPRKKYPKRRSKRACNAAHWILYKKLRDGWHDLPSLYEYFQGLDRSTVHGMANRLVEKGLADKAVAPTKNGNKFVYSTTGAYIKKAEFRDILGLYERKK